MSISGLHRGLAVPALLIGLLAAAPSFAQQTWSASFDVGSCPVDNPAQHLKTCTGTNGIGAVNVTGWGAQTSTVTSGTSNNTRALTAGAEFAAKNLGGPWDDNGLGVYSGTDSGTNGTHSVDNQYHTDAILVHFSTAVTLSQLTIGWGSGDSDVSLFAYTGATAPTGANESALADSAMANTKVYGDPSISKAISSSWTLVGNYGDANNPNGSSGTDTPINVNGSGVVSSWWLISAYNSRYGGACTNGGSSPSVSCGDGNDLFKVLAVAGTAAQNIPAPEPGSLALVGIAALGLLSAKRRRSLK